MKRSGYEPDSYAWESEYYEELRTLADIRMTKTVFAPLPSLRAREVVSGYREEMPYEGQEFDPERYQYIEGAWDHEHCHVCRFRIEEGHSFWTTAQHVILCDECADYVRRTRAPTGGSAGA